MSASEIVAARPISEIWVALGGDVPKRGRAPAFYRHGHNQQAVALNDDKACWYDHRDNIGGGVLDLVQHVLRCDRGAALRWIADLFGLPLDDRPMTAAERRQYARRRAQAEGEAGELVAWKQGLVDALKRKRTRWWKLYHAAREYIRDHGLESGLGAGLADIYEAAEVDGAGAWSRFRYVTLPLLRPVLAVVILFSTIFTFSDFNIVYVLTRGGPVNTTHLFATLAYQVGLQGGNLGQGAAISLFLFPMLGVVVFLQLRYIRRE